MKRLVLILIMLIPVFGAHAQGGTAERHALLVGIGNYSHDSTGWKHISAARDIVILSQALEFQGFSDIQVIADKQATREGILDALDAFLKSLHRGDIAVIHFSCHGQHLKDLNKDEPDGLDEAIVPIDAPANSRYFEICGNKNYAGEKHLRDDDLAAYITLMRQSLGPQGDLIVTLDACYSGTGTRGDAVIRGGEPALFVAAGDPNKTATKNTFFGFSGDDSGAGLSHYVVITASRAYELNYETVENGLSYGSLSYALSKSLTTCSPGTTYRGLFANICNIMGRCVPRQSPTIEGDYDRLLFGGNAVYQEPYLTVEKMISPLEYEISAGILSGIYDSTRVSFYPAGTSISGSSAPLAKGIVISNGYIRSVVRLSDSLSLHSIKDVWVFVDGRIFPDVGIRIALGDFATATLRAEVESVIRQNDVVIQGGDAPELIIEEATSSGTPGVNIVIAATRAVYAGNILPGAVTEKLLGYAQARFIRNLETRSDDYSIVLDFIPVKGYLNERDQFVVSDTLNIADYMVCGVREFPEGVNFLMKLTNIGRKKAYFSVINIQSDGIINAVLPAGSQAYKYSPENYYLLPGASLIWNQYAVSFSPPYGKELYKVFATETPVNLGFIVSDKGVEKRGNETPLERLFRGTYNMNLMSRSGAGTNILEATGIGITDITLIIKPPD